MSDVEEIGGKAARLRQLQQLGWNVPPFSVIPVAQVQDLLNVAGVEKMVRELAPTDEISPDLLQRLRLAVEQAPPVPWEKEFCEREGTWAVRSSGIDEDGAENAMAGHFESELRVGKARMPWALRRVAASAFAAHLWQGKRVGDLHRPQRLAVIVQQLVPDPQFSGAFFTHAGDFDPMPVLEARHMDYADRQMDGTQEPDVVVRCSPDGERLVLEKKPTQCPDTLLLDAFGPVVAQALKIHSMTGCGDCEFVVDVANRVHWVQARPLTHKIARAVEIVDRRGFAATSVLYYRQLAFYVGKANRIPPVHMELFDFGEGRFGYDIGIRDRDRVFHRIIRKNTEHLRKHRLRQLRGDANSRIKSIIFSSDTPQLST